MRATSEATKRSSGAAPVDQRRPIYFFGRACAREFEADFEREAELRAIARGAATGFALKTAVLKRLQGNSTWRRNS